MKTKNTDIPLEIMAKFDAELRLFDGDISPEVLAKSDIPFVKSWVQARLYNLEKSRELLKTGKVDSFAKRDVAAGLARPGALPEITDK
jgi:hypothetical protein